MDKHSRFVAGFAWATVLTAIAFFTIFTSAPTALQPMNLAVLLPIWMSAEVLGRYCFIAILFVPAFFLGWCWTILRDGSAKVPGRSFALFVMAGLLSLFSVIAGGSYAIEYQSVDYLHRVWPISILWWLGLTALACLADRRPSLALNLVFHFALFAWLAWYALPYMGELP